MIWNGDPRADGCTVLYIRIRTGQPSTPLQGDTCADTNLQCPVPWNHGFNEDNGSVQLPGNSCADNGSAQLLDANPVLAAQLSSCLRELVRITRSPEESMQRTGWCLGPRVRIAMVSSSSAWVGPLVCPVLRELVRVWLLWALRSRVAGYPYLWAPVRITGVSSCLTIVLCG